MLAMDVSIAEAENKLPELIRAMESGEKVVITRDGKPVAQLAPAEPEPSTSDEGRGVRLGTMRDRIKFNPGWDDPIDEDKFLAGDI